MNWRLGVALWLIGFPGVLALGWWLFQSGLPVPQPGVTASMIAAGSVLQNSLLLALAVFAGTRLAVRIGLQAPVLSAVLAGKPAGEGIRTGIRAAMVGGLLGVIVLWGSSALLAVGAEARHEPNLPPLIVRVLYGGLTEEILLRWGLMTVVAWLIWRQSSNEAGLLSPRIAWTAIAISAVVFAAAHLPAANAMYGSLSMPRVVYVMAGNTAFGLLAGYLFWRRGLEAAIVAHVLAHLGFAALPGV